MKRVISCYIIFLCIVYIIPILLATPKEEVHISASSQTISVYFHNEDKVLKLPLEEYLLGVVAAEMPVSFPLEALKAQAVASRSYALDKISSGGSQIEGHKGADVCTDSSHCKAWISKEKRFESWNESDCEKNWAKLTAAVTETTGEYMSFNGEPITAVFYAISSGTTERAEDVWGGDVPYLQNADSSLDKKAPGYKSTAQFSVKEFKNIMKTAYPDIVLSGTPEKWYSNETRSAGGGIISCKIGDVTLKGTQVRTLFSLRSHNFSLSFDGENFNFEVLGYGHGVGMSQWGAKFYADEGKNYRDILRIYYKGINFEKLPLDNG